MATPTDPYGLDAQKTAMDTIVTARRTARATPSVGEVQNRLKANLDHLTTQRADALRQEMAQFEAEAGTITFKQYIDALPDVYAGATGGADVFGSFDTIQVTVKGPGKAPQNAQKLSKLEETYQKTLEGMERDVIVRAGLDPDTLPIDFTINSLTPEQLETAAESYKGILGIVGLGGRGAHKKVVSAIEAKKKYDREASKSATGPSQRSFEIDHLTQDIYGKVDEIATYAVSVATDGKAPKVSVKITDSTGMLPADSAAIETALGQFIEFKTDAKKRAKFLRGVYDKRLESELSAAKESIGTFNPREIAADEAKTALQASLEKIEAGMPASLKAKIDAYASEAKTVGETFEEAQKYQKVIDLFEADFASYSQSQMPSATFGLQTLPGKVTGSSPEGTALANSFAQRHSAEIERVLGKDAYSEFASAEGDAYGHVSGKLGEALKKHKEAFGRLEGAAKDFEKEAKGNSAILRTYFATLTGLGEDDARKADALRAAIPYLEAERVAATQTRQVGDTVYMPEPALAATLKKGYAPSISTA